MIRYFSAARTPQLYFGVGKQTMLPALVKAYGSRALLVTGARSFISSQYGPSVFQQLKDKNIHYEHYPVTTEPTPDIIDRAVKQYREFSPDVVVAIGGGSALDAGKAISAMLPIDRGVKDFLEGVGTAAHPGDKVPFIAMPTTSGTGSEATRNAVISEIGDHGYKRSLRHDNFVPDVALIDPVLMFACPADVTAASGMDAFTQLLESYLSTSANPFTDALALEGLRRVGQSLIACLQTGDHMVARTDMAFASYLSGITLANAGLGLVHGFASSIGGYFSVPHGVICSTLMGPSNRITVRKLRQTRGNPQALRKYAVAGSIFSSMANRSDEYYTDFLLKMIDSWIEQMNIPSLSRFGITSHHFQKIASSTNSKNNPIALDTEEMIEVLQLAVH